MKFCEEIDKKKLVETAMKIVSSAGSEIFVTMHVDEELKQPLSQAYHQLLRDKQKNRVKIVRYGYGTRAAFAVLKQKHVGITFVYKGRLEKYQRMLLVDTSKGLFSVNGRFFYTEFSNLIAALRAFAEEEL